MSRYKTEIIQIRLTPAEKEIFRLLADRAKMSQSEYLRWLIARESATL
jgi:hypothetical protein